MVECDDEKLEEIETFLEATFHSIIFTEDIYPKQAFKSQNIYGIPVKFCDHPQVASYISNSTDAIEKLIEKKQGHQIYLNILDGDKKPMNRYIFQICHLMNANDLSSNKEEIYELFRSTILKILSNGTPKVQAKGSSFVIQIEATKEFLKETSSNSKDIQWKKINEKQLKDGKYANENNTEITPLKTIDFQSLRFQIMMIQPS